MIMVNFLIVIMVTLMIHDDYDILMIKMTTKTMM